MQRALIHFATIAFFLSYSFARSSEQIALGDEGRQLSDYACPDHHYMVHLFSSDPLVIYIPEFITREEASHLQAVSKNKFTKSEVITESGTRANTTARRSRSTVPPRDSVIRCIEDRALSFQGLLDTQASRSRLEPLQLVAYDDVGENYQFHTDWFGLPSQTTDEYGGDRLSSFFVYVTVTEDLTGGGTNFPLLDAPMEDGRWCRYVNCDEPWDNGVTFRPVARNAVFWRNLRRDGSGDRRTLHAGLPVTSGRKTGMNIWTRERAVSSVYRGED